MLALYLEEDFDRSFVVAPSPPMSQTELRARLMRWKIVAPHSDGATS